VIVADTNLLIYLYVAGERTAQAEAVLRRDPIWVAPLLWRSEFRNALLGLIRRQVLTLADAAQIIQEAESHMAGHEYSVVSGEVLALAEQSGCSSYDCEYISLAIHLNTPLVTADQQLCTAFPKIAVQPERFLRAPR